MGGRGRCAGRRCCGAVWAGSPALWPGVALLVLTTVGLVRGTCSLAGSVRHTKAFAAQARRHLTGIPPRLAAAAHQAGIGSRLVVADLASPFALSYGALRPRVLASTGLVAVLSDTELAAVLAHEREHLRGRDPLKNVLARAIPARHFYLPALAGLPAEGRRGAGLGHGRAGRRDEHARPAGRPHQPARNRRRAAACPGRAYSSPAVRRRRAPGRGVGCLVGGHRRALHADVRAVVVPGAPCTYDS